MSTTDTPTTPSKVDRLVATVVNGVGADTLPMTSWFRPSSVDLQQAGLPKAGADVWRLDRTAQRYVG